MTEKFYCVGCKQHYELKVHAAQRQPSKGGSFRHSLISECPKGHRVNKLCKKEVYETYSGEDKKMSAERRFPHPPTRKENWKPAEGIRHNKSLRPGKMMVTKNADNFGDMEYILLNVMTKEQVIDEYGDYMEDSGITIKQLPQKLQDDYRTDEEAEYLRDKYLKLDDGDVECDSCSGIYEKEDGKMVDSKFICIDCEDFDAETFESPYVGSKALSGISLTTDQLTETIGSGDFDKASLNSSGHQNIFANAEEGSPNMNHLSKEEQIAFLKQLIKETKGKVQKPYELTPGGYGFGLNGKVVSAEVYLKHLQEMASEEGNAPVQDPMEFGEMANWTPLDGTPSLRKRKRAEGMTVGVNLEALEPTPDEPETGVSMVPADSLLPEGSGHVIGSQSTSHNFTPFHAEVAYAVSWEGKEDNNEGLIYGIEYTDEVGGVADVEWFATTDERDEELARYLEKYGAESLNAETFIAYPELKNHLVSIMPDKVYNITLMEDGDFEMSVANRYMDEVISAVSNYQATEKSDSDLVFGQSKTTVAVAAASLAVVGAWLWNKRK